jgi:hypothetical protein
MAFDYETSTAPFFRVGGAAPAVFQLHQVGDDSFAVMESFEYRRDGAGPELVDRNHLAGTNLASIPSWLGWFMRRHGRHTAAALMHDDLVREGRPPPAPFPKRLEYDQRFRDALLASGVKPVKAGLMWAAVTWASRHHAPRQAALLDLWLLAAFAGMGLLAFGGYTADPVLIVVALLAPIPAAAFWGRQFHAGVIAGYALPVVLLGSVPAMVAYYLYWVVEGVYGLAVQRDDATAPPRWDKR